jgi:hypothetical protein
MGVYERHFRKDSRLSIGLVPLVRFLPTPPTSFFTSSPPKASLSSTLTLDYSRREEAALALEAQGLDAITSPIGK